MNYRSIAHVLGILLLVTAAALLLPVGCSIFYDSEGDLGALFAASAVSFGLGFPLWFCFRGHQNLGLRDSFFIAFFGWVVMSAVSALPFVFHGTIPAFSDAFFEMMSGYTTTGATVLSDIEAVPHGLLLWRSETNLLGGMGFLTLTLLFLPHGMSSTRVFRADAAPGQVVTREKFTPRSRDAIVSLWVIYLVLNGAEILLLWGGGMPMFEAICHSFATISTSGYSPMNASIGHYDSLWFDWVVIVFMFLGGCSFMLLYQAARKNWQAVRVNTELRWYVGIVLAFCLAVCAILWWKGTYGPVDALRHGSFQVVSLLSTTGFTTADYEQWPAAAQMLLYAVCFVGACAGSTTSGIKIVHYAILWKFMVGVVRKLFLQPLAVVSVRINEIRVDQAVIQLTVCYFIINIVLILGGGCILALSDELDPMSAMSAIVATLMNIGPGFGDVGPTRNYAEFSTFAKWFLSWNMLVGRLEAFTALVVFYPAFWRR